MTLRVRARAAWAALVVSGCLLAGAAPGAAQNIDAQDQAALRQASVYISSIQHMQGTFEQIGPNGEASTGTFYISRPGKVRFDYDRPSRLQLLADGRTVAIRDRGDNSQDLYPLSQTPLRYLLAERVDLTREAKVIDVYRESGATTIVIEDSTAAGTGRLAMRFDEGFELRQWTITDPQGLDTTVRLSGVQFGRQMDPSIFRIRNLRDLN